MVKDFQSSLVATSVETESSKVTCLMTSFSETTSFSFKQMLAFRSRLAFSYVSEKVISLVALFRQFD